MYIAPLKIINNTKSQLLFGWPLKDGRETLK